MAASTPRVAPVPALIWAPAGEGVGRFWTLRVRGSLVPVTLASLAWAALLTPVSPDLTHTRAQRKGGCEGEASQQGLPWAPTPCPQAHSPSTWEPFAAGHPGSSDIGPFRDGLSQTPSLLHLLHDGPWAGNLSRLCLLSFYLSITQGQPDQSGPRGDSSQARHPPQHPPPLTSTPALLCPLVSIITAFPH